MRHSVNKPLSLIFVAAAGLSLPVGAMALGVSAAGHEVSGDHVTSQRATTELVTMDARSMKYHQMQTADKGTAGMRRLPPKAVKVVQRALNHHGAKLKTNGRMGLKTTEALINFQEKHDLVPTGYINAKTAAKLGILADLKGDGVHLVGGASPQSSLA